MKLRLIRAAVLAVILTSGAAYAVTLGDARVNSYLNQPLDVEIELVGVAEDEHQDLRLRIADRQHFDRLGIIEHPILRQLKFDVVRSGRTWLVRARTDQPVTEPFVDFPVQMSWPDGKLIKQITVLLDPPGRAAPASVRGASTTPARATPRPTAQLDSNRDNYGPVRAGETLWPIAERLKPAGITTRQMAMGLYRNNPQAFINGDINLLKQGATLAIPPRGFIEELGPREANRQFNDLALGKRPPPVTATSRDIESLPSAPLLSDTPTEEPAAVPADEPVTPAAQEPRLRIVNENEENKAEPGSEQDLQSQLLATMEDIESNRITTGAIEDRLARLEEELGRMQKLLALKDEQISALQAAETAAREAIEDAAASVEGTLPPAIGADAQTVADADNIVIDVDTGDGATDAPIAVETDALPENVLRQRPWYEEYIWVAWILIGVLGLTTLILLFRRPQQIVAEPALAGLAAAGGAATGVARANDLSAVDQAPHHAEPDLRVADAIGEAPPPVEPAAEPELAINARQIDDASHDEFTDSLLDELLDAEKASTEAESAGKTVIRESDFDDDDDLATWVAELENEADPTGSRSANDEDLELKLDVPDLITEIDDELSHTEPKAERPSGGHQPDMVDEIVEDDTFTMSLDLARAYLEIGDQEGAKDMLQQALSGARNPEHRRQIEELLEQID